MNSRIPLRDDAYQVNEMDGELLLYHAGKTETLYLNESAAMVWYLCDGERSEKDIVELLSESYPEAAESMSDEVREAIEVFVEFGGIEFK
ncbi:MAG: hypothetical protein DHS20C01_12330 [marine bacterium B5-7]|nr:MAG: hypothetical protein DHS20C01_12330 [marine bacterium B5-7]